MAGKLSKRQRRELKEKHKRKRIKKLESQDARGISRKKYNFVVEPKTFLIMKIVGIVLIPLVYFFFSTMLAFVMIYFIVLYFLAIGCEHSLNKSVIKSNHIKIPKYDSAIAMLLLCVSVFAGIFNVSTAPVGRFANTMSSQLWTSIKNIGSLLTGVRNLFSPVPNFNFGPMDKPEGFIPDGDAFREEFGGQMGGPGGRPNIDFSMDDIPIEFMFSQILSTAVTVMVFAVMVLGIISLYTTWKKIKKFETEMNTVIIEKSLGLLTDDEIADIVDFGDTEEEM